MHYFRRNLLKALSETVKSDGQNQNVKKLENGTQKLIFSLDSVNVLFNNSVYNFSYTSLFICNILQLIVAHINQSQTCNK